MGLNSKRMKKDEKEQIKENEEITNQKEDKVEKMDVRRKEQLKEDTQDQDEANEEQPQIQPGLSDNLENPRKVEDNEDLENDQTSESGSCLESSSNESIDLEHNNDTHQNIILNEKVDFHYNEDDRKILKESKGFKMELPENAKMNEKELLELEENTSQEPQQDEITKEEDTPDHDSTHSVECKMNDSQTFTIAEKNSNEEMKDIEKLNTLIEQPPSPPQNSSNTIFVMNIPANTTETHLRKHFLSCGSIKSIKVRKLKNHDLSATIEFFNKRSGVFGLKMNGSLIGARRILVRWLKTR